MDIQVTGLDSLVSKLDKLGVNVNKIVDEGLRECALAIQAEAKENILKKDIYDTGKLFGSISVEEIPNGYSVGTNLEYAAYQEFGTGEKGDPSVPHTLRAVWHYKDGRNVERTVTGIKPRPFLRPAFKKKYRIAKQAIRTKLLNERIK